MLNLDAANTGHEAAEQNWSSRQFDRQISVLYCERLLASRRKAPVRKEAAAKLAERLTRDLGRGSDERNLWYMRRFYLASPILNASRSESGRAGKRNALRSELAMIVPPTGRPGLRGEGRRVGRRPGGW